MKPQRALSFLLILALLAPGPARAGGKPAPGFDISNCQPLSPMSADEEKAFKTCAEIVASKELFDSERMSTSAWVDLAFSTARCFKGVGDGIFDAVKGVAYFMKLLFHEAPKWAWHKSKEAYAAAKAKVLKWWEDSDDAVSGSIAASDENASMYDGLADKAEELYAAAAKAVGDFFRMVHRTIQEEWHEFACLPPSLQSEAMCKLVTEAFLVIVTPDKLLKGAKWAKDLGVAVKGVMAKLKAAPLAGSLSQKITQAGVYLERGVAAVKEVKVFKRMGTSRVVEVVDEAGNVSMKYERKIVKDGKEFWESLPVMKDGRTSAITTATREGMEFLTDTVKHLASQSGKVKSTVAVIDLNFLGKVNYFKGSLSAGDAYLKEVSKLIEKVVRNDDLLFRYGGDEFVLALEKVSPQEAQAILSKINKAIAESEELKKIFTVQRKLMKDRYAVVKKVKSYDELVAKAGDTLTKKELAEAAKDFAAFQKRFVDDELALIKEMSKQRPTVSIGSTMLKEGDTVEGAVERASKQVGEVKADYYEKMGIDASKYGGKPAPKGTKPVDSHAIPEVQLPVE